MLYYFLAAIILIGLFTSYEDIKEGKIRNKYIILALIYTLLAYVFIITIYYFGGVPIRAEYFIEFIINGVIALLVGFLLWYSRVWTAGDGKLFFAYSLLVPLSAYSFGYIKYFPSLVILINTFLPIFIFLFVGLLLKTTRQQKVDSAKKILSLNNIISLIISLFVFSWVTNLFPLAGIPKNYFTVIIFLFIITLFFERILHFGQIKIYALFFILRLIFDKGVYSLDFLAYFLKLSGLFVIIRYFIIELGHEMFSKKFRIEELKPKMILAENIYKEGGRYKKEKQIIISFKSSMKSLLKAEKREYLTDFSPEGLKEEDIDIIRKLKSEKKLDFSEIKIQQSMPFAPFMFLGVVLTIFFKGNVVNFFIQEKNFYWFAVSLIPVIFGFILMSAVILIFINIKTILTLFDRIKKKTWLLLIIVFLISLIIRLFFIPHTHYVYFDEFEHVNIAQNMVEQGSLCRCFASSSDRCYDCRIADWPSGSHFFISIFFFFFGSSEGVAFNVTAILSSISIILMFLFSYLLFKKEDIALWSALLFALVPTYIKFSGSAALAPISLFFVLFSFLFFLVYIEKKSIPLFFIFILMLAYTINIRPENLIFLFIFIVAFFVFDKDIKKLKNPYVIAGCLVFLVLIIPYFIHVSGGIGKAPGWSFSLESIKNNFNVNIVQNIKFWFGYRYSPVFYILFAILGSFFYLEKNKKKALFYIGFFILFLLLYSSYHIGGFSRSSIRYSFNLYFILIILASLGLSKSLELFKEKNIRYFISCLLIILFIFGVYLSWPYIKNPLSSEKEQEYKFILSLKNYIPENCTVFAFNPPTIITTIHKKTIHEDYLEEYFDDDCSIFLKDVWCYEWDRIARCNKIENNYNLVVINETSLPTNKRMGFYYLVKNNNI